MVLYDTDLVFELNHVRLPPEHPDEQDYTVVEQLPKDSIALEQTNLSTEQIIFELKNLERKGLVDFVQPFDDAEIVVARLTASGFDVAHGKHRMQRDEEWRKQSRIFDIMLTGATVLLAVDAWFQITNQVSLKNTQPRPLELTLVAIAVFIFAIYIRRTKRKMYS